MKVFLFLIVILGIHPLNAQFCALHVRVTEQGLMSAGEVRVSLVKQGNVVESKLTVDGYTSFCDFGLGDHQIVVHGDKGCYDSAVNGIRLSAFFEQKIHVVRNICFFDGVYTSPPGCHVLLRVDNWKAHSHRALSVLFLDNRGKGRPDAFDIYGRVRSYLKEFDSVAIRVMDGDSVVFLESLKCVDRRDLIKEIKLN